MSLSSILPVAFRVDDHWMNKMDNNKIFYSSWKFSDIQGAKFIVFADESHGLDGFDFVPFSFVNNTNNQNCVNYLNGGRLEAFTPASYIVTILIYSVLGILLFYYRNDQPLKSRGLSPFILYFAIMVLFQYDYLLGLQTNEWIAENICTCFTIVFPFISIALLAGGVVLWKYIFVINLSRFKQTIDIRSKREPYLLRFLNLISSNNFIVFISIIMYVTGVLAAGIIMAVRGKCVYLEVANVNIVMNVIAVCVSYAAILFDLVTNLKRIIKCQILSVIRDDIFFFRIDAPGVSILCGILFSFSARVPGQVLHGLYYSVAYWVLTFFGFGLTLLVTMVKKMFAKEHIADDGLKRKISQLFEVRELENMFRAHCEREFNIENYMLKKYINEYKRKSSPDLAEDIQKMFLNGSASLLEVNIDHGSLVEFQKRVKSQQYTCNLFDSIEEPLYENLRDIYLRFEKTLEYQRFIYIENLKEQELVSSPRTPPSITPLNLTSPRGGSEMMSPRNGRKSGNSDTTSFFSGFLDNMFDRHKSPGWGIETMKSPGRDMMSPKSPGREFISPGREEISSTPKSSGTDVLTPGRDVEVNLPIVEQLEKTYQQDRRETVENVQIINKLTLE